MRFSRIDRSKSIIKYARPITKTEILDSVYVLRLFDNELYYNVDGFFVKAKDTQLAVQQQAKGYSQKHSHLYSINELYDRIYEGWGFGSTNQPARLICKRKYPINHRQPDLRLVKITRKYA
ncbi:hypothetical protein SAMN04487792_1610 [Lactobacillus bombicola]|uniref:Uncharacterized protein n=1 Tax=Lactobacillus bombicola TaxID=1505723 RepID=A0A1I1TZX6_9LACO|nr:hypothetical protein [Lactobacillus bombicola]SFD61983.1 hypothetical protein SAMN04487792_1610 [Lactobacillus bombicola]